MNKPGIIAPKPVLDSSISRIEPQKTAISFDEKVKIETADMLLSSTAQYSRWQSLRQNNDQRVGQIADFLLQRNYLILANSNGDSVDWSSFDNLTSKLNRLGIKLYDSSSFRNQQEAILPSRQQPLKYVSPTVTPQQLNPVLLDSVPATNLVNQSETSSPASLLNEENSLIFSMLCEPIGLKRSAFGYGDEKVTLLPLGRITKALDLKVDVDPASGKASGWFISEDRTFALDVNSQKLQIGGKSIPLQQDTVFVYDNEIFVDSKTLSSWLPLDFEVSRAEMTVSINPREKLPLQARMEREQRRLLLNSGGDEPLKYPVRKLDYDVFSFPVVDVSMSGGIGNEALERAELQSRYSVLARGDLFYMNSHIYFGGYQDDPLNTARIRLERYDPEAGMLGSLKASQIALGDIIPTNFPILQNTSPERGMYISNADLAVNSNFDVTTFEGNVLPGWEVELYHNDDLIDSLNVHSDGRYLFEDVPLFFGENDFQVLAYGPQGQKKVLDTKSFPVGSEMLPGGEHQYHLSTSQRKNTLLGIDEGSIVDLDDSVRIRGKYKYGLADSLSLASGAASVEFDGERHNYLQVGLSGNLSFLYGQADYLYDTTGGSGLSLFAQTAVGPFNIKAKHEFFNDFVMENSPNNILKSKTEVDINGSIPGTIVSPPMSYTLSSSNTEYEEFNLDYLSARLSAKIGSIHLNNTTQWNYDDARPGDDKNLFDGNFQASGNIGDVRLTGGVKYGIGVDGESRITQSILTGHWPINEKLSTGFDLIRDSDYYERTSGSLNLNWDAGSVMVSPSVSYNSEDKFGAFLTFSFSLGRDPVNSSWRMHSERLANSGTAQALVYHDANNNQVFDQGDTSLPEVDVIARQARKTIATGEDGHAALVGLPAYNPTDLEIDVDTLEDPFWQPSIAGTAIRPRPGHVDYVEFPVVSTGEIDGTIYTVDEQGGKISLSSVILELIDTEGQVVQTTNSEYDGFYLFEKVFPGNYLLRISPDDGKNSALAKGKEMQVTIGNDGTIASGTDIRLQGPGDDDIPDMAKPEEYDIWNTFAQLNDANQAPVMKKIPENHGVIPKSRPDKTFVAESLVKPQIAIIPEKIIASTFENIVPKTVDPIKQKLLVKSEPFRPFEVISPPIQAFVQTQEVAASRSVAQTENISQAVNLPGKNYKYESKDMLSQVKEEKIRNIQPRNNVIMAEQKVESASELFEVITPPIAPFLPIGEPINIATARRQDYNKSMNVYRSASNSAGGNSMVGLKGVV